MPKTFYTERDIEDLARRGVISLVEDDDVVLTDIAREKAMRLGIEIVHRYDRPPSAPQRPYITAMALPSAAKSGSGAATSSSTGPTLPSRSSASSGDVFEKVRSEVIARLGDTVDPQLLDTIIRRVLQDVGLK